MLFARSALDRPLLLLAFLLLTLGAICNQSVLGQEDDEVIEEIRERLADAKAARELVRQQAALAEKPIRLLEKGISVRREMIKLERRLEETEESDDEEAIDELREQIEWKEFWLEVAEGELELYDRMRETLNLSREIHAEGQEEFFKPIKRVIELQRKQLRERQRLAKAIENGDEEDIEELEIEIEELTHEADTRFEIIELRRALIWAEEENESDEIEEIEKRLEWLRDELGIESDDAPQSEAIKTDTSALPVKLTTEEIIAAGKDSFQHRMSTALREACFECHDSQSALGDLDLESMVQVSPLVVRRSDWINVIAQLKNRSMPPADAKQPTEENRKYMTAWLTDRIENFDYSTVRQVGYEPAKRLTHDEYNHTIRDLFGVDLRPADKFPDDMVASSGFENSANSLFIQPITMERYVGAADEIASQVFKNKASRSRLLSIDGLPSKDVSRLIERFATRAFRRPISADELKTLVDYCQRQQVDGQSLQSALQSTVQAILVSPSFLIRSETANTQKSYRINDWELASRLSYFLWASMPDDELFDLAKRGELHKPAVLHEQVDRMIADPKSLAFGSLFAAQWLGYDDLNRVRPGPIDNPWCTDSLCQAMTDESGMFFHSLVTQNAPIEELITGDYTYLNEELAKHYGIPNVRGKAMRRVDLAETPRGGILGHASILAVTSFPGRTSPVLRGNWILTELLGTPPPPPPPNASEFDERISENRRLSQRQKLQRHRNNPNCYACHSQIDPLGFSLEQFDWFGRFRPKSRGRMLTAEGEFPNGTKLVGLKGLRDVITTERLDHLVVQLTRKMTSYALGRQLEYYDEATVQGIVQAVQSDNRKIGTLIHSIVASDTFQMQQPLPPSSKKDNPSDK